MSLNFNVMQYFRKMSNSEENSLDSILYSYDLQAGSYRDNYYHGYNQRAHINNRKTTLKTTAFKKLYGKSIADTFNKLGYSSILEVGVGEATTLCDITKNLDNKEVVINGIDISFSRIGYGNIFLEEQRVNNVVLGVANMFELPFKENSFDIVYTSHCIEPNTNRAKDAVAELYRVAKHYVVLIEPSYILGNNETKKHIKDHAYCNNIIETIYSMNLDVIEHRLFDIGTYDNQSSIIIIENKTNKKSETTLPVTGWCCPVCTTQLTQHNGHYFCQECFLIYPVIKNIPCLLRENGILGSKYLNI